MLHVSDMDYIDRFKQDRFSMTASARREQHERNEAEGRMGKRRGMRHCDDGR